MENYIFNASASDVYDPFIIMYSVAMVANSFYEPTHSIQNMFSPPEFFLLL